jgi:hypothetical protein
MGACDRTVKKVSTCLYIDKQVLQTAKRVGLNLSKVSENALAEAIRRLGGPKRENGLPSQANREGRGRDSNPGARLHRPVGYQATSPRPHFNIVFPDPDHFLWMGLFSFSE